MMFQVTLFHFEDEPRDGASNVISFLRKKGKLDIMMLTGDHKLSARRVAKVLGIEEVYFGLKPEDKLNHVKKVSREKGELLYEQPESPYTPSADSRYVCL